jgi:hypothetical protein
MRVFSERQPAVAVAALAFVVLNIAVVLPVPGAAGGAFWNVTVSFPLLRMLLDVKHFRVSAVRVWGGRARVRQSCGH